MAQDLTPRGCFDTWNVEVKIPKSCLGLSLVTPLKVLLCFVGSYGSTPQGSEGWLQTVALCTVGRGWTMSVLCLYSQYQKSWHKPGVALFLHVIADISNWYEDGRVLLR